MVSWRRPFARPESAYAPGGQTASHSSLEYVEDKGGNDAPPNYQEASGAPVETVSPLGYAVGPVTIMFLNISMMIGTGIFSTPSAILAGTGSVGLALFYWVIGFVLSLTSLAVYLEYAAYFPSRSGSETAYLEQAYPRPRFLITTIFAVQNILLSFSASNCIVLAQYLFKTAGTTPTPWQLKGVAIAAYTVTLLLVSFHTKTSYYVSNSIGVVKVLTLVFISITGLVVLGGHTKVADPTVNFKNAFQNFDGPPTPYGLTNALYRIIFSYGGYNNAFNVVNEVKNPVKRIKYNGGLALVIVAVLYMLTNIAYFSAVSVKDLASSGQTAASLFFANALGQSNATRGLNFLVALSSFGNLLAVILGSSRLLRECGRQGVLPGSRFLVSTRPFGTPLGPYSVKYAVTIIVLLALPAGDAFNFASDLAVYPSALFNLAMAVGLYIVRWRRRRANLPQPQFKAWDIAVIFNIIIQIYLLVLPWWPPTSGKGDVSFWYGTYIVTGIMIIVVCGLYYWVYIKLVPQVFGYRWRQEVTTLAGGEQLSTLVKVPVDQLVAWDNSHDAAGRRLDDSNAASFTGEKSSTNVEINKEI